MTLPIAMNELITNISQLIFSWTVIAILLGWLLAAGYPLLTKFLRHFDATTASSITLSYSLLAPASATLSLVILFHPALAPALVAEHCHHGVCGPHKLYIHTTTAIGTGSIIVTVVVTCVAALLLCSQLMTNRRWAHLLEQLSEQATTDYRLVETPSQAAWCAGLWRPKVYISRSLWKTLDEKQLELVLKHEFIHAWRRDNLRKWILHWASAAWPPALKRQLRRDFTGSLEKICDLYATGSEIAIEEFRSVVNKMGQHSDADTRGAHQPSIHQQSIHQQRIDALKREFTLAAATPEGRGILRSLGSSTLLAALWVLITVLAISLGHPLLEWLAQ